MPRHYGLVQRSGAVVIGTGPNLYERFVTDAGYCELTQTTEPALDSDRGQPAVPRRQTLH